jgi:hypothetical protein
MGGVDGFGARLCGLAMHGPGVQMRPAAHARADVQPRAAGLGAPGFGLGEVVVVGGAARIEATEGVDPPAADQGAGTDGLAVHPAIMGRSARLQSAELERKNR